MAQKHYRIRLRGKQREEIDVDLFTEALLAVIRELRTDDEIPDDEDNIPEEDCE